jgi:hypothetical protein
MGLIYRRSRRVTPNTRINYGTGGVSGTWRLGLFTINTRGRFTVRLGRGLSWRIGR